MPYLESSNTFRAIVSVRLFRIEKSEGRNRRGWNGTGSIVNKPCEWKLRQARFNNWYCVQSNLVSSSVPGLVPLWMRQIQMLGIRRAAFWEIHISQQNVPENIKKNSGRKAAKFLNFSWNAETIIKQWSSSRYRIIWRWSLEIFPFHLDGQIFKKRRTLSSWEK